MNLKIDLQKADWSTAYVNDLPDSAFLYIQSGGEKDSEGKTKPRTLRHFPYKDSSGKVDLIHVRNAIARIPQSTFGLSSEQMKALQNKVRKYLKGSKTMDKSLTIDLEKAKYKKRIPKAGGGYRYIYEDKDPRTKNKIEYPEGKTVSRGINKNNDGTYTARTYSQSKDFKTRKGAEKWLASRGINPDGTKKSIGDNDMSKAFDELNDFLKSTIEDEGQPTIGTGKEQGAAMGLDGKGENKGTPGTGSSTPEVGNPPKSKVDKLSEDDEVDEDNMKPHKKPIEKSIPLNTWNQTEYMQREHRMYRDACENSDGDIDFSKAMMNKGQTGNIDGTISKSLSSDDQVVELIKSEQYITAGNSSALGFHNQLVQKHICSNCENAFMKALTVCPYCGH